MSDGREIPAASSSGQPDSPTEPRTPTTPNADSLPPSPSYNTRNPAVRRLLHEARELQNATDQFWARPLEDNLFEWHFTIGGPVSTEFEHGLYHGRIIMPPDFPLKPPSFIFVSPNGRFETNRKICLSISGHHPETWQPSWSIRTALVALIAFLPTPGGGAIGSLEYPAEERKKLAAKSRQFVCSDCGAVTGHLLKPAPKTTLSTTKPAEERQEKTEKSLSGVASTSGASSSSQNQTETSEQAESARTQASSANLHFPNGEHFQFLPGFAQQQPQLVNPAMALGGIGAASTPPPIVAAAYLPWLYQSVHAYASYYAQQAAVAAVVAGATHQRLFNNHNINNNNQPESSAAAGGGNRNNQQAHLTPADLVAQQQHRERRASAYLFAVILIAWTITRFIDRFFVI